MRGRPAKVFSHGVLLSGLFDYTGAQIVEIFKNATVQEKRMQVANLTLLRRGGSLPAVLRYNVALALPPSITATILSHNMKP